VGMAVYYMLRRLLRGGTSSVLILNKLFKCVDRLIQFLLVLSLLGWNMFLIVVFCSQKTLFLPSFFFDFYLYLGLLMFIPLLWYLRRKGGADRFRDMFVKFEQVHTGDESARNDESRRGIEDKPQAGQIELQVMP
jgi:hypothetical protein